MSNGQDFVAWIAILTQEPSTSPKLLDLCRATIVHRFTSLNCLNMLTQYLAGMSAGSKVASVLDDMIQSDEQWGRTNGAGGLHGVAVSLEDLILELSLYNII